MSDREEIFSLTWGREEVERRNQEQNEAVAGGPERGHERNSMRDFKPQGNTYVSNTHFFGGRKYIDTVDDTNCYRNYGITVYIRSCRM